MPEPKRFLLRLDPRMFEALRRWADDDMRSINAQIEYLLALELRRSGRLGRKSEAGEDERSSEAPQEDGAPPEG